VTVAALLLDPWEAILATFAAQAFAVTLNYAIARRFGGGILERVREQQRLGFLQRLQENIDLFGQVGVEVVEGRVLLTGSVPDPEARVTAVRLAWQAPSVREVINEIQASDTSGVGNYTRDTWISTQLKSKLLLDGDVSSINYTVDTVNQVVYIMGLGQDKAEIERVIGHAKSVPYVRRVVSYALAKDDPARRS